MNIHAAKQFLFITFFLILTGSVSTHALTPGMEENRDYEYALGLHSDGGYEMAAREFERFIEEYPSSERIGEARYFIADSRYHMKWFEHTVELTNRIRRDNPSIPVVDRVLFLEGSALFHLQRYHEAILALNRIVSAFPESGLAAEALYTIAESRLAVKNDLQAAETFRSIPEKYPASAAAERALYRLGVISETSGDFRGALTAFGQLFQKYPKSSLRDVCRFRMGECYFRIGDYKNAVSMMSDVVNTAGSPAMKARGYYLLGEANFHMGAYALARKYFQKLSGEFPDDPLAREARESLGWTYFQEKRFDKAAEVFSAIGEENPENGSLDSSIFRMALTRKLAGDNPGAGQAFNELISRFPESRYAERSFYELGIMAYEAGRFGEAAESFLRLATRYPKSDLKPESLVMYGQSLLENGDYGAALTAFTEVTESYRNSSAYPFGLSIRSFCEFKLNRLEEAARTAELFIRNFPEHPHAPDVLLILAEVRYLLADFEGARRLYLAVLEKFPLFPRMAEVLYDIGWSSLRTGDYDQAADVFSRLLERYPRSALTLDAAYRIGDCRFAAGNYAPAIEAYEAVLERNPEAPFAGQAALRSGQAMYYSGDHNRALHAAERVISQYPLPDILDEAQNLKGMSLMKLQRFPEAIDIFKTIVKPSKLADESIYQAGACYYAMREFNRANETWERLLSEFPRSPRVDDAVSGMLDRYMSRGQNTRAARLADELAAKYPWKKFSDTLLRKKGDTAFEEKKFDEAAEIYQRVIEENPDGGNAPRAMYMIGMSRLAKGDSLGARAVFGNLPSKYPSSGYARLADMQMASAEETLLEPHSVAGPFVLSGDRISTIAFTPEKLDRPTETGTIHASGELPRPISDSRTGESFDVRRGFTGAVNGELGSHTLFNMSGSASWDDEDRAATIRLLSRSRTENTPANLAPAVRAFDASGYSDSPYGDIDFNLGVRWENEDALSRGFRSRDRAMEQYSGAAGIRSIIAGSWDFRGKMGFLGGRYRDSEIHSGRNEADFEGAFTLDGEIDEVTVTSSSAVSYLRFGSEYGSMFALGGSGKWLPWDGFGVTGGATMYSSAMPGHDTKVRLYPEVAADWTISPGAFAKLAFKPRVTGHSFRDLYEMNGLVVYDVPLLFEDRMRDLTAECGVRPRPDVTLTGSFFVNRSAHAPVFSRKGSLFEVVENARVTTSGTRFGARYDAHRWGMNGSFTARKSSWNFSGHVPYIPNVELAADAYAVPRELCTVRCALKFMGTHYVAKDSNSSEKGFMTMDVGMEREFPRNHVRASVEIRNLLNSNGTWWTDEYRIPGVGLYARLWARY